MLVICHPCKNFSLQNSHGTVRVDKTFYKENRVQLFCAHLGGTLPVCLPLVPGVFVGYTHCNVHIGCICSTFLHCAFSNVPKQCVCPMPLVPGVFVGCTQEGSGCVHREWAQWNLDLVFSYFLRDPWMKVLTTTITTEYPETSGTWIIFQGCGVARRKAQTAWTESDQSEINPVLLPSSCFMISALCKFLAAFVQCLNKSILPYCQSPDSWYRPCVHLSGFHPVFKNYC